MDELTHAEIVNALASMRHHGCTCLPTFERMPSNANLIRVYHTHNCAIADLAGATIKSVTADYNDLVVKLEDGRELTASTCSCCGQTVHLESPDEEDET